VGLRLLALILDYGDRPLRVPRESVWPLKRGAVLGLERRDMDPVTEAIGARRTWENGSGSASIVGLPTTDLGAPAST